MSIKRTFTPKKKGSRYGDQFTPEQKKEYWEKKKKEIGQKKIDFVMSVIEYAKSNEHFPWEEPNFTIFPQSLYKLKQIEKYEQEHPDVKVPSKVAAYQGSNILKLYIYGKAAGYKDNRWITLPHIWKLGGKISDHDRKHAGVTIWVVNPEGTIKRKFNANTGKLEIVYKKDEKTGEFLFDKNGNKIPERTMTISTQEVFNVEIVSGLNLPPMKKTKVLSETQNSPEMDSIISHSEAPVIHDQFYGFERYYSVDMDEIHLPPKEMFKSITAYYATVAHEIGHSTGHPSRLNRKFGNMFGDSKYAREEMVAELTSVFLSQELGVQIPQKEITSHQEYLRNWDAEINILTEKPEELYAIISDAEKATKYIKEHMLEKELQHDNVLDAIKKINVFEETKKIDILANKPDITFEVEPEKQLKKEETKSVSSSKKKGMER